jgi:Flp pilus assembly secretin CpaC
MAAPSRSMYAGLTGPASALREHQMRDTALMQMRRTNAVEAGTKAAEGVHADLSRLENLLRETNSTQARIVEQIAAVPGLVSRLASIEDSLLAEAAARKSSIGSLQELIRANKVGSKSWAMGINGQSDKVGVDAEIKAIVSCTYVGCRLTVRRAA